MDRTVLFFIAALWIAGAAAQAEATDGTPTRAVAADPEPERARSLAERFHAPEQQVLDLRAQKLGWGEIGHLLAIAEKSGQPVETIQSLRQSGMGWGKIARKYGLSLGKVRREVRAAELGIKSIEPADKPPRERLEKRTDRRERLNARVGKPPRRERNK